MEERLKQQMAFIVEADKVKIFFARPILQTERERKTMQNIPGILHWQLCF